MLRKAQGMWRVNGQKDADYTDVLELDLATVEPSLAGPSRPQDRVPLKTAKAAFQKAYAKQSEERAKKNPAATGLGTATVGGSSFEVKDGAVLIAAITSCTNTSNPYVLIAAGLGGPQCAQGRADFQALGEDLAGARLARGHRLPQRRRPAG